MPAWASLGGPALKNLPAIQKMQETPRVWSLGWEDPLEEGMATHSSILAWRLPRTGRPGGLQSIASHTVRHDCDLAHSHKYSSKALVHHILSEVCVDEATASVDHPLCHLPEEGDTRDVAKATTLFKINFYWSIVDLQCCVSLCSIAKWISYINIHSF